MTNEFFLHPVSATHAKRVPFPLELPLEQRDAYMAHPPAEALDEAALVPFVSEPVSPLQSVFTPAPTPPVFPTPVFAAPDLHPLTED